MHVTINDVSVCDGLECVHAYLKFKIRASTALINAIINIKFLFIYFIYTTFYEGGTISYK